MILSFIFVYCLEAQTPIGELVSVELAPNKDTLVMNRKYGDWWYGLMAGPNYNLFFSDLKITSKNIQSIFSQETIYSNGSGAGYFVGGVVEYTPRGKMWGGGVRLSYDSRFGMAETDMDTHKVFNRFNADLGYLSFNPYARYHIAEGLYVTGGLDFDVNIVQSAEHIKVEQEAKLTDEVQTKFPTKLNETLFRFGVNVGAGYDIYVLDWDNRARVRFTPFITLHAGTPMVRDNNSTWNSFMVHLGFQVKIGPDEITIDTLKFDPDYKEPPVYFATLQHESGVEFPGFKQQVFIAADLTYSDDVFSEELAIYKEAEKPRVDTAQVVEEIDVAVSAVDTPPTPPAAPVINTNREENFEFPTAAATGLTRQLTEYLDELAKFLKANPSYEVAIVGHSDNTGTLVQNTERSVRRAENVVNYLMSKGIARGRLLNTGVGSVDPIAPNTTPEGRRANRRVEIVVRQ